jgi:hypothetical protein
MKWCSKLKFSQKHNPGGEKQRKQAQIKCNRERKEGRKEERKEGRKEGRKGRREGWREEERRKKIKYNEWALVATWEARIGRIKFRGQPG